MKNNFKIAGIIFLIIGLGLNQFTLAKFFPLLEPRLTLPREILIAIFNIFFSGLGILFIINKNDKKKLLFSIIVFFLSFGVLFAGGEILVRLFSSTFKFFPTNDPVNIYNFDPPMGITFKANLEATHKSKDFQVEFKTNSQGFRSSQEFITGSKKTKTMAVLGDSFVAALQVDEEKTFIKLLESKLAGSNIKQVQNYGMDGAGITHYLRAYEYYVKKHSPSLVIISIFHNDFDEPVDFSSLSFSAYTLLDKIDNFLTQRLALYKFSYILYEKSKLMTLHIFPKDGYLYEQPWNDDSKKTYEYFSKALWQLVGEIKKDGSQPIILIMPSHIESSDAIWKELEKSYNIIGGKNTLDRNRIRNELQALADKMDVEIIDPTDSFKQAYQNGNVLYYPYDNHLNPAGHQLITEIISAKILKILNNN